MPTNPRSIPATRGIDNVWSNCLYQAYRALQAGFIAAPILAAWTSSSDC